MFFDVHAHYDDEKYKQDRKEVLERAHESGVEYIVNSASSVASLEETVKLAHNYEYIFAAVGIHPHDVDNVDEEIFNKVYMLAKKSKVVAIGETGLDYYYDFVSRDLQKKWLREHIELAKNLNMPLVIHNRESHEDVLRIIKSEKAKTVGGLFHCYSGSVEMAEIIMKNNFYISVGGIVTFKKVRKIIEVIRSTPLDRLLIETDCPYMTPVPYRGKRNDSSYIVYTARKIAEILKMDVEEIAEVTKQNAKTLFGID